MMASNRLFRIVLAAGCATLWIASLGCGSGEESTAGATSGASATPPPIEKGSRKITLPGMTAGDSVVADVVSGEMPKDFPEDIPTPPDSEPRNSMFIPGQGGMATFLSKASPTDVVAYYSKELSGKGWDVEAPAKEEMRTVIKAKKGGRQVRAIIAAGSGGSEVMITVQGG